ncbi:uncharacterized protein BXZ73DRAFT_106522 [Epithele typhae]|uniref:uncharacterized protein n=1 Tax=Epithele typhae TaxID=378194 RepID=UPI0020073981|nr:uncharacterized protein BXZ73DRAFT_106522 [Epithele typhae]KAH9914620.1 hypothetical protein BXZ73DRAFT_106522 [Epithele typhae]
MGSVLFRDPVSRQTTAFTRVPFQYSCPTDYSKFEGETAPWFFIRCTSDFDAILHLQLPCVLNTIEATALMKAEMLSNIDRKATQWTITAFQGKKSKEKTVALHHTTDSEICGTVDDSWTLTTSDAPPPGFTPEPRSDGLDPKRSWAPGHPLFMKFYKMKCRFRKGTVLTLVAQDGPHVLPRGDSVTDVGGSHASGFLSIENNDLGYHADEVYGVAFDPVGDALDYILAKSVAEIAIACDSDLYDIFKPPGLIRKTKLLGGFSFSLSYSANRVSAR